MNNARRILSKGSTLLKGYWFWSKKLHFQKNFGRKFTAVEGVSRTTELFSQDCKVTSSNPAHRESVSGRMKSGGQHPFELRSPRIPPGAGRNIREGQHQPLERMEARMRVRLRGRAMLSRLVVVAINYDFVRTVKSYDLAWYAK